MGDRRSGESVNDRRAYLTALCRTVPYHIVEAVLANPTEHAVKDRTIEGCLLHADLVGFTPLCERMALDGPDGLSRLSQLLDQMFEHLLENGIFPFNGYVVQFGGDSVTVVFEDRDAYRRAVASALTLQRIMRDEVDRLVPGPSRELMLRVGLAAGRIDLPVIGDLTRRVVVCAGSTAHRAIKMQQNAQPDEIAADASVVEALDASLIAVPRGTLWIVQDLKSWPEKVPIRDLDPRVQDRVEEKIALLEPFVPQPLAARLRTTRGRRLEGELRTVAVMFVELWGLDEGGRAPDMAREMARSLPRTIHKYGGTLSKADLAPRGHRAMALFGLTSPTENDAERAVLAALEITTRVKGFTLDRDVDIALRIGVHSGKVYFGAIGSTHKHDITAIGDAVNVAARTAAAAHPFEVLATEAALDGVERRFDASERRPMRVKGRREPLRLHVVHGVASGRAHYVQRRRQNRYLAGRDEAQQKLRDIVEEASAGRAQIVGICGEPGTGKSSMLSAVADLWVERGGFGVLGRCLFATRSSPLAPIVTMFHNFLGFTESDSDVFRRDRLRFMLSSYDIQEGAEELVALLQPVQRPDGSTETLLDLADTLARERVVEAVLHFVRKRIEQGALLYMVEDLHHADSLTLHLVSRIAALDRTRPFLLIGTYRHDPLLRDVRRSFDREINLGNLDAPQIATLVQHELGAERVESSLVEFFARRTHGNPAHLVEVVRFLVDRHLIRVRTGTVVPASPNLDLIEDAVPQNMAYVALARFDTLGETERRLLRTAAAIGRRFRRVLLERVSATDLEPDLLESAMATLERQRVLTRDETEQPGYSFRDDAMRAVAYETIPEAERRQVHRRIADVLERLPDPDTRGTATTLAWHRERAGQLPEALSWYDLAIRLSASLAMDRETLDLIERYQRVLEQLPSENQPDIATRARVAVLRLIATARAGAPTAAVAVGRQLSVEFGSQLDGATWATVDYWLGDALLALGKPEKSRARLEHAYANGQDSALRSDSARRVAATHAVAQDREQTELWLQRALDMAGDDIYRQALIEMERAHLLLYVGELVAARIILQKLHWGAVQRNDPVVAAAALSDLARVALANGDFDEARRGFEEAVRLDRQLGDYAREAFDLNHLGQTLLWSGHPDAAMASLETALAAAIELGSTSLIAEAEVHLGAAIALARDPVEGQAMSEEGYRKAVRADLREVEIAADLHLLRIALFRRDATAVATAHARCAAHAHHLGPPVYQRVYQDALTAAASFTQQGS